MGQDCLQYYLQLALYVHIYTPPVLFSRLPLPAYKGNTRGRRQLRAKIPKSRYLIVLITLDIPLL